jgi:protein SCO1/2
MSKTQKALTITAWSLLVLAMVSLVASGMYNRQPKLPVLGQAPAFSMIDQNGKAFTDADLNDTVWVADFVFTRCAGPCPTMMEKMAKVQQATAGADVRLVSFTVDPQNDTPQVLKEFGRKYNADESRWTLATGELDAIMDLSRKMMIAVAPATDSAPIEHGTWLLLIDGQGRIRGNYSAKDDQGWRKLSEDATALAGRSARR